MSYKQLNEWFAIQQAFKQGDIQQTKNGESFNEGGKH